MNCSALTGLMRVTIRFGASSLLASLLKALGHGDGQSASSY